MWDNFKNDFITPDVNGFKGGHYVDCVSNEFYND